MREGHLGALGSRGHWGDTGLCLGTSVVVTTVGVRVLLASTGWETRMLLHTPQCPGQTPARERPSPEREWGRVGRDLTLVRNQRQVQSTLSLCEATVTLIPFDPLNDPAWALIIPILQMRKARPSVMPQRRDVKPDLSDSVWGMESRTGIQGHQQEHRSERSPGSAPLLRPVSSARSGGTGAGQVRAVGVRSH